jgi:hypothetical protein
MKVPKMAATVAPRIAINVVFGHALGDGPVRTVVWEGRSREAPRLLIYSGIGKAESLRGRTASIAPLDDAVALVFSPFRV